MDTKTNDYRVVLKQWKKKDFISYFKELSITYSRFTLQDCIDLSTFITYFDSDIQEFETNTTHNKVVVTEILDEQGKLERSNDVYKIIRSPEDILQYLWYRHTGHSRITKPKYLKEEFGSKLKLKYDRKTCRKVAAWLTMLPMGSEKSAEIMNNHREIWIRFIRALRLCEYAKKPGFNRLDIILRTFHENK